VTHDEETSDMILGGMGELHLEILVDRLRTDFSVRCETSSPSVAYRETITQSSEEQYRHVKQTGGHGQFAHVVMRFEPLESNGFEFEVRIRGGSVPLEYHSAIQKGVVDAMEQGVLARYSVTGVKAILLDGTHHEVDSSEMAFRLAGAQCFKKAALKAGPRILEPIMKIDIATPDEYIGDIVGDLGARRGRVTAMRRYRKGSQKIDGVVPLAEMFGYSTPLRTMSSGRANFSMEFNEYQPVPLAVQEKIVAERKKP